MQRRNSLSHAGKRLGFLLALGMACGASLVAQQGRGGTAQAPQGGAEGPRASNALPVFRVEWVRPPSQTGQVPIVQENIADPNLELKEYGAAKDPLDDQDLRLPRGSARCKTGRWNSARGRPHRRVGCHVLGARIPAG